MPTPDFFSNDFFAAFIMTYERPEILLETIKNLQHQTLSPSYILVIDNSESTKTEIAVKRLQEQEVGYYRVGYNSGPAGAAKIGLERLTAKGFKWIYWGDDDNPPAENTVFEDLFQQLRKMEEPDKVGVLGGKGGKLNLWTGKINTFSNSDLLEYETLEVDMVPGGGTLLVNSKVVKKQVLPSAKLFFGFEELDFCLKVQKEGFRVVVYTKIWLQENHKLGLTDENFRWKDSFFGNQKLLWRSYYSTRNLLYIFFTNGLFAPFLVLLLKSLLKSVAGFRYGKTYGKKNFAIQWRAIKHFISGTYGRV